MSLLIDLQIKLYDHRLVSRGPVQSYEGHVNTHTRLQLGVDPYERFVVSGAFFYLFFQFKGFLVSYMYDI